MGLKLYFRRNDEYIEVSSSSAFTSPILSVHDGKDGDIVSTQLFLRNDDSNLYFTNIVIWPYDLTNTVNKDDTDYESTGWGTKLSVGSEEPTTAAWGNINWGDSIDMSDIGASGSSDTSTYYPFWRLLTCPPHTNAQIKRNLVIRVEYTENAV
jgi:hypothetical protein